MPKSCHKNNVLNPPIKNLPKFVSKQMNHKICFKKFENCSTVCTKIRTRPQIHSKLIIDLRLHKKKQPHISNSRKFKSLANVHTLGKVTHQSHK